MSLGSVIRVCPSRSLEIKLNLDMLLSWQSREGNLAKIEEPGDSDITKI